MLEDSYLEENYIVYIESPADPLAWLDTATDEELELQELVHWGDCDYHGREYTSPGLKALHAKRREQRPVDVHMF